MIGGTSLMMRGTKNPGLRGQPGRIHRKQAGGGRARSGGRGQASGWAEAGQAYLGILRGLGTWARSRDCMHWAAAKRSGGSTNRAPSGAEGALTISKNPMKDCWEQSSP